MNAIDWQPIETAPRDGTVFLARVSDTYLCGFAPSAYESRRFVLAKFKLVWEIGYPEGRSSGGGDDQFTHWMPLPDPPSDVSVENGVGSAAATG